MATIATKKASTSTIGTNGINRSMNGDGPVAGVDIDDVRILNIIHGNPYLHQSEIAKAIGKSQPAVGARVIKLERRHFLEKQYGINLSKMAQEGLRMAVVTMHAKNSADIIKEAACCPFVLNAFTLLGNDNIVVWLVGTSIPRLEEIVELHFRSRPDVTSLHMALVTDTLKDAIFPVDFNAENPVHASCTTACHVMAAERSAMGDHARYEPSKDATTFNDILHVDDIDKQILMMLQFRPEITQTEMARVVGMSQPAVSSRIENLKEKGVMALQAGVNFAKADDLLLVQVSIDASSVRGVMARLRDCPRVSGGFRTASSSKTIVFYMAGTSLGMVEDEIDRCIRADPYVRDVETAVITSHARDLILPCDLSDPGECIACAAPARDIDASEVLAILSEARQRRYAEADAEAR